MKRTGKNNSGVSVIDPNIGRLIIDGTEVHFKYNIRQALEFDNAVVVWLEVKARDDDINNVYGVIDGKIAWRVQDMLEYNPTSISPFSHRCSLQPMRQALRLMP